MAKPLRVLLESCPPDRAGDVAERIPRVLRAYRLAQGYGIQRPQCVQAPVG